MGFWRQKKRRPVSRSDLPHQLVVLVKSRSSPIVIFMCLRTLIALLFVSFCCSDRRIRLARKTRSFGMMIFFRSYPDCTIPLEPGSFDMVAHMLSTAVSLRLIGVASVFDAAP